MATPITTLQNQLPEFVGKGSTLTETFKIDLEGLDQAAEDRLATFEQMFVEHGTWGLKFWEIFLGIAVDESFPVEIRRANIKSKIQASHTLTVAQLRQMFEAFGYVVTELIEDNLQYQIQVRTANSPKDYPELMAFARALQVVFPAHLDLVVVSEEHVNKVTADIEELGWALVTPNEKYLYVLGESVGSSDYYNQLSKIYKYDANTLKKISVIDYGTTYNAATTPGYKMYKANAAMSDNKIFIQCLEVKAAVDAGYKTQDIDRLATIDCGTGALTVNNLHTILGETKTFVNYAGIVVYNSIKGLRVHYDTNDNYLYLFYYVGDYSFNYDLDVDTRQWYVARINPVTLTLISKTLIPKTTHITKYEFIDTTVSYPQSERTTWYSDCYGGNVQIIRGIKGDYAIFFDRQIQHKVVSSQPNPQYTPFITTNDDLYRRNPLVQVMSLSSLTLSTVKTPEIKNYAKRFGGGGTDNWWSVYKDSKTNLSNYFGLPVHFPRVYHGSNTEEGLIDSKNWPEVVYGLISIDPVSHEIIARYDVLGSATTSNWSNVYWNSVPRNTTEDMSLWMHTSLNPMDNYKRYYQYGVTKPLYPDDGRPVSWNAYHDTKFGVLRYPFTAYDSGGVQSWNEEVVTAVEWFDDAGNQGSALYPTQEKRSRLYTAQNNSNLVYYMYDTRNFDHFLYNEDPKYIRHDFANAPTAVGRQLVRTPERLYNKFRLWSLLGY